MHFFGLNMQTEIQPGNANTVLIDPQPFYTSIEVEEEWK